MRLRNLSTGNLVEVPWSGEVPEGWEREEGSPAPDCSAVTRKAFICVGCDAVYADEPVTACDCCIDLDHPKGANLFIEGQITYMKQNSPAQPPNG